MFAQTADVEHDKCHGRISSVSTTQQKVSTTVSLTRRRYLRSNVISPEVFEFVEKFFNLDITIPTSLPHWLWGGSVSFRKHPSLKLKFLNPEMMTEEEREIKDLKEKKVKDKEEYYRKRKNGSLQQLQLYWVANCETSLTYSSLQIFWIIYWTRRFQLVMGLVATVNNHNLMGPPHKQPLYRHQRLEEATRRTSMTVAIAMKAMKFRHTIRTQRMSCWWMWM